ncbi:response regulator [Desulfococcaceae bacterium HSG8]|nr:response regulator [Desulfococcaceae bacterium HSG8]
MSLRFLIVYESVIIRNIIQKYILTDHVGAIADTSDSPENAVKMLEQKKYHAVFAGLEMPGMTGPDFHDRMRGTELNLDTPFIIMTPTDSKARQDKLARQGIRYILPIPFTSVQFRSLTDRVFSPDADGVIFRSDIPKSKAVIRTGNRQIPADVVNIGRNHIVCELTCPEELGNMEKATQITVHFPVDYGKAIVVDITGSLLGLRDKYRIRDGSSRRLLITWEIAWSFFELSTATKKTLKMFFSQTPEPVPDLRETLENISAANAALTGENKNLRAETDAMKIKKQELLRELEKLRKETAGLKKAGFNIPLKDVSLSALINEAARRSDDPAKVPIFKQIIEDNVKLRRDT